MKERIKALRKSLSLNQTQFGEVAGVSRSAVQKWESGENDVSDSVILLLCQKFPVSENWLRTGNGEMLRSESREVELHHAVGRILADRKDSFKTAVVTTLLKFEPDGPEWTVLEDIYKSIEAEMKNGE